MADHPSEGSDQPVELFVELYRAGSLFEAEELVAALEEAGISSRVENALLQGGLGELPPGWNTLPRIAVPKKSLAEARNVLERGIDDAAERQSSDDSCLACNEPMQDEDACRNCGWSWGISHETAFEDSGQKSAVDSEGSPTNVESSLSEEAGASGENLNRSDRELWMELSVVAAVTVIPSFCFAVLNIFEPAAQSFVADSINLFVTSVCAAWVPVYLVRNNGESLSDFGIERPQIADIIAGLLIVPLTEIPWIVYWNIIPVSAEIVPEVEFSQSFTNIEYLLLIASQLANAFHEELVLRAYLITRLCVLLKSRRRAVLLAAATFASYHIYQGAIATGEIFLFGVFFGVLWLLFRRLWPLVIAHAVSNILIVTGAWW